jgi:TonB family protein
MRRLYLALLISACALFAQTDAPGWLDRGVQAFKNARYDEATDAFQHSVDLDPSNLKARLYLATVFFAQYIPGATSPENVAFAEKARAEFEHVLTIEPDNKTAMQYLASIAYQTASGTADLDEKFHRLDEARGWYEKLIAADPQNKEAWYSLGVIDWLKWYPKWMEALQQASMKPDMGRPILNSNLRQKLRTSSGQLVEDGLMKLTKALEIDPRYSEAMAYMNLLVRERASLDDTQEQYEKDIALADDWVQESLEAKKAKAEESGGDTTAGQMPPPPAGVQRIRVGAEVQAANLIRTVPPVYPQLAEEARIQGTVRFRIIIAADGHVQNLQLVSGHPLLVKAARDAVQQWVYRPTLLNGEPVEVVTTVDVNFTLSAP